MSDVKPIPREELDRAVRISCRRLAAVIVKCMADTDTSFALIAVRVDMTAEAVRAKLNTLMDGDCSNTSLGDAAVILWAMGARLEFHVEPMPKA